MPFPLLVSLFLAASLAQSLSYGLTFLLPDLFGTFGGAVSDAGRVLSLVGVFAVTSAVLLGAFIRVLGHMRALALCCFCSAAALALFATSSHVALQVYLAAALFGVGWSGFYVLGPLILAKMLQPEDRPRYFSWLAAFIMAGIGGAPILASFAASFDVEIGQVFFMVACLSALAGAVFGALTSAIAMSNEWHNDSNEGLSFSAAVRVMQSRAWRPVVMVMLGAAVFAAILNFQSIYAAQVGQSYSLFYGVYTFTVIIGRFVVAGLDLKVAPYALIAAFLAAMALAVICLLPGTPHQWLYALAALLFGIGYGLAYPILKAMAANDAAPGLQDATLQLFGLGYFVGIFGFPLIGALILQAASMQLLLTLALALASLECLLAVDRYWRDRKTHPVRA
ncbi:MAG: MFS transporter [Pseudomonadota bacterium]